MNVARVVVLGCILSSGSLVGSGATPENSIRQVLEQQLTAWNGGDLKGFVAGYAEHCTLVGSSISETTREQVLAHYQQKYPSTGAMGKLIFSALNIHTLDGRVAVVTGGWQLHRAAAFGGPAGGVFSLVFELLGDSWHIVLDHTS